MPRINTDYVFSSGAVEVSYRAIMHERLSTAEALTAVCFRLVHVDKNLRPDPLSLVADNVI